MLILVLQVKFHLAMRLAQSLATGDDVNNTYEFAVEARAAEPLRILPSQLARHALSSEFKYYIIAWFGLLFIRRGIYGGGIFRFNVRIPSDFPATTSLPSVKFDLFIFHPNIDPSSRRPDLTRYFPDGWKKDKHHIQNVLLVVQRLFFSFDFDPESSANPVAATMWREDKEKFRSIAKNCVNQSRMEVYDEPEDANDPNVLRREDFRFDDNPKRERTSSTLVKDHVPSLM
ncbi:ubiquitin--protein ligase [Ancylostoma ceylanicum]|uniref:Ubiquitin--protein ligase n=1 Tax=Ancylostoma ceylanicum TaxID=53326 RepID=A0A0D6LU63_9BILA|nr:ubiquitin--protein ligase [Ancylostoma ceylanicum]